MYFDINKTGSNGTTEKNITAYKLYNLLFCGKITILEYLQGLKTLTDNQKGS